MNKQNTIENIAVSLKNVSFGYGGELVLTNVSCDIQAGEYVALVGHNGSGKTTLLQLMLGLRSPHKGTILLFGKDTTQFKSWNWIGYVPQYSPLRAAQTPLRVDEVVGMETANTDEIVDALDAVGMKSYAHALVRELSGGQQQRVFIARALVKRPKLLILDEPTVGVDQITQDKFYDLLDKFNKKYGMTIILVSHDLHTVSHRVQKVMQLDRKMFTYTTNDCYVDHIHEKHGNAH